MKRKTTLIVIVAVLFCLMVTAYAQTQRPAVTAGQGWEYQEIKLSRTESAQPKLNALGAEGWELVNVISACEDGAYCVYYAYLKRRK